MCFILKYHEINLIYREGLFSLNQLQIFFNSILISFSSWIWSLWEKRILVSSAKNMKWEEGEERGRSFMYKRNKNVPRIDPCGTPQKYHCGWNWCYYRQHIASCWKGNF